MDLSIIKNLAIQHLKIRFFDVEANIWSDSEDYINILSQMYPRFLVNGATPSNLPSIEFAVLTKPNNPWGQPVIIVDGEIRPLTTPRMREEYIYEIIFSVLIHRVRGYFLMHAGVVARNDQAVIIMADSMHGKTTTVLELIRRGFDFLSDEVAALGREDGRVHPFPRSLRIRQGTLDRVGFTQLASNALKYHDRLILDIDAIRPNSLGQTANIKHIVILQNPIQAKTQKLKEEITIGVNHLDEELVAAISQIEGVTKVCPDFVYGYPALRLQTRQRLVVFPQIEAICQKQQVVLIGTIWGRERTGPAFDQPAHLKSMTKSQTVMKMMHYCLGLNEADENSTYLFMELANLISQANCYKLSVGPLNQMADLICSLFDQ